MTLINIADIKAQAAQEINEERTAKAKNALVKQLRAVAAAEDVVRAEKLKLEDLERQITDGTL